MDLAEQDIEGEDNMTESARKKRRLNPQRPQAAMKRARDEDSNAGGGSAAKKPKKTVVGGPAATVKPGYKLCLDCKIVKENSNFKPGNGICSDPCLKVKENIYNACRAEGLLDWFNEQRLGNNKK